MLYWLTEKIIIAYIFSTLIFLCLRFVIKTAKSITLKFLDLSNGLVLIDLFLNIFIVVRNTIECRSSQLNILQKPEELGYPFYYTNCYSLLIWTIILGFIFHLCFLKRHFRTKKWATVTSLILLTILINADRISIFITCMYRDYLPSSWSVYYESSDKIWAVAISVIYFLICWTFSRLKFKSAA